MAMTMTQKILAAHAGLDEVKAGQLVLVKLDRVLGNDITSPVAIREFNRMGFDQVYDKDKVTMVMDHFAPNKDIKAAVQCKMCRDFCNDKEVTHFYDVGRMGIGRGRGNRCRFPYLYLWRFGRFFHRRWIYRYGGRNGDRQGLAEGSLCYSVCVKRFFETLCIRQRCDFTYHW